MTANASLIGITSEFVVTTESLKRGYNVLHPVGGFLAYDLVLDINKILIKVQVKTASKNGKRFCCTTCRMINNKYRSGQEKYNIGDFDFAAVVVKDTSIFLVPFTVFTASSSFNIPVVGGGKNEQYRSAWHLLEEFASNADRCRHPAFNPVNERFNSFWGRFGVE